MAEIDIGLRIRDVNRVTKIVGSLAGDRFGGRGADKPTTAEEENMGHANRRAWPN
jgi:hypothetical protein